MTLPGATDRIQNSGDPSSPQKPFCKLAVAVILGIFAGWCLPDFLGWFLAAICGMTVMLVMFFLKRYRGTMHWGVLAVMLLAAAWQVVHSQYVHHHDVIKYLPQGTKTLVTVTGMVTEVKPKRSAGIGTAGRQFTLPPDTRFILDLRSFIDADRNTIPVCGKLLVTMRQEDHRIAGGMMIEATGWLNEIERALNPGQTDFLAIYARRGIRGRLILSHRDNWRPLPTSAGDRLSYLPACIHHYLATRADDSLRLGFESHAAALGLLQELLLGKRDGNGDSDSRREIREQFRNVGLAHILAISGAHLGIVLGLVWCLGRMVISSPRRLSIVVLAVVMLFVIVIPPRAPVLRAAVMAAVFCLGYAFGRRVAAIELLAIAAMIILLYRPSELFTPGFQLSFIAVAFLITCTGPFMTWLWPPPVADLPGRPAWRAPLRWLTGYFAVSVIAFLAVMPLVACHFHMISPPAIVLSVLTLPLLVILLAMGYLKIGLGLLWPVLGEVLAPPLEWSADLLIAITQWTDSIPGSSIQLPRQPTIIWAVAMFLFVLTLLSGRFAGRRRSLLAASSILIIWTIGYQCVSFDAFETRTTLTVNYLAVGDGNCFLIRSPGLTALYDCGSRYHASVGRQVAAPALSELGVRRIDLLMISHPDFDHYGGVVDLLDQFEVAQLLLTPQFMAEVEANPRRTTTQLLRMAGERDIKVQLVSDPWRYETDQVQLALIWPPGQYNSGGKNDASMVLSIEAAGRRILFTGDVETEAITVLLDRDVDWHADVIDLPHHGGHLPEADRWLDATEPDLVIQSSHYDYSTPDNWQQVLSTRKIRRYITGRDGMIELRVYPDGQIDLSTFLK